MVVTPMKTSILFAGDPRTWTGLFLKTTAVILFTLLATASAQAATWYVDNAATGRNTGTSWTDAWTSLNRSRELARGDIVYVSGGATSKVYNMGRWDPPSGNSSAQFTLSIGQEAGHNGTAIFRNNSATHAWLGFCNYVTINGGIIIRTGFASKTMVLIAYMDADGRTGATGVKLLGITTPNGSIRMYDSRKTEIGWIVFEPYKRSGGPGCIQGVGRGD